jgi:hypothetical protein
MLYSFCNSFFIVDNRNLTHTLNVNAAPPLRSCSDLSFSDSLFQRFKNSFSVLKIVSTTRWKLSDISTILIFTVFPGKSCLEKNFPQKLHVRTSFVSFTATPWECHAAVRNCHYCSWSHVDHDETIIVGTTLASFFLWISSQCLVAPTSRCTRRLSSKKCGCRALQHVVYRNQAIGDWWKCRYGSNIVGSTRRAKEKGTISIAKEPKRLVVGIRIVGIW